MKAVSRDQSHEVIGRVMRNTDWGQLDGDVLQQRVIEMPEQEFGRRFTQFLKNGASFVMKGPVSLVVDRTKPFNPAIFIGSGWTIWRGAKNGTGLEGEEAQDASSLALIEVDFAKARFTACLKDGETVITGEEKLARHLAAKHIRLDAKIGQCLLEERDQATLEWLYQAFNIPWFELPGTILRDSYGGRCFLCLYRDDGGRWDWYDGWLDDVRGARSLSAVLAS
jgi:hypothetical protein